MDFHIPVSEFRIRGYSTIRVITLLHSSQVQLPKATVNSKVNGQSSHHKIGLKGHMTTEILECFQWNHTTPF